LARVAWETIREVHCAVLDRNDVVPDAVAGIQTFGQLVHWHMSPNRQARTSTRW